MSTTFAVRTAGLASRLDQHLMHLKWAVERAAADVRVTGAAVRARSDRARAAVEARRAEIDQARARLTADLADDEAGTAAAVAGSGAQPTVFSLRRRAERAEQRAA